MDGWLVISWLVVVVVVGLAEPEEISGSRYEFHSPKYRGPER